MTKIAIVTGASRGIGRALALELVERDITVFAIARNEAALRALQTLRPEKIQIIAADIATDSGQEKILKKLNNIKIDFLINNAGIINPIGTLHKAKKQEIRKLFEINLLAPIFLTNALVPQCNENGARIFNITSVAGNEAVPGLGAYCASKAALNLWAATLKKELPAHIVAANVIPGEVESDMQGDLRNAPLEEFSLATEFKEAKNQNTLIPSELCAEFLADVLLKTTAAEFTNKTWNIYNDFNKPVPQPLNKKKLAKEQES